VAQVFDTHSTGKLPGKLDFTDLDAPLASDFLNWLETSRGNSVTTRNARLAAIRSLFSYAALQVPEHAALTARVLAIPAKCHDHATVSFLTRAETEALLAAPGTATWHGRCDHALLTLAAQTGLRVSELTSLTSPTPAWPRAARAPGGRHKAWICCDSSGSPRAAETADAATGTRQAADPYTGTGQP
jgi:integrase